MDKKAIGLILILIFVFGLLGARSYYAFAINLPNSNDGSMAGFVIESGQGVEEIAKSLERVGLIRSAALFRLYISLSNLSSALQAGEYKVAKNLKLTEVVDLLQHGTFEEKLTFIEGWRREEMAGEIAKLKSQNSKLNAPDFLRETEGLEGRLFPDTYFITNETTAAELVKMMRDNFEKKVASILDEPVNGQPNLPGITFSQVVIIASIVEREVKFADDKPIVAGILIKRLLNDWALQADATVQYALGYQSDPAPGGWWKKNLASNDLEVESPYNTYRNPGLPPTAIGNPGLGSIKAAISPVETDYWYYVSDAEGRMHFARNNEEHNRNISRYVRY